MRELFERRPVRKVHCNINKSEQVSIALRYIEARDYRSGDWDTITYNVYQLKVRVSKRVSKRDEPVGNIDMRIPVHEFCESALERQVRLCVDAIRMRRLKNAAPIHVAVTDLLDPNCMDDYDTRWERRMEREERMKEREEYERMKSNIAWLEQRERELNYAKVYGI